MILGPEIMYKRPLIQHRLKIGDSWKLPKYVRIGV